MNINTQIDRGLERLMCQREGSRLQGLHGLAGMGCAETFSGLAGLLDEAGFAGVDDHVRGMKKAHRRMCEALKSALPVAVDAMRVQEMGGLGSILSKISKKLKKLSPSHALLKKALPKIAKHEGVKLVKQTPDQKAAAKAAKAAKKQAKKDAKAAKKAAKAAAALQAANAQNLPPAAAGAAVLANESGVNLATPAAQQFGQELVSSAAQPGSGIPQASLTDSAAPEDGAVDDGTIFGIPKPWAIGGGLALVAVGAYAMRRRGR